MPILDYPDVSTLRDYPLGDKLVQLHYTVWTNNARAINIEKYSKNDNFDLRNKDYIEQLLRNNNELLKTETVREIYYDHIIKCFAGLNGIFENNAKFFIDIGWPREKLEQDNVRNASTSDKPLVAFLNFLESLNSFENKHTKQFLRTTLLYHDIGKAIHRDKHPTLGKHLLENIDHNTIKTYPFGQRILPGRSAGAIFIPLDRHKASDIFNRIAV
jgi:hypothetical protein